ncbi:unnamed protein product [Coffea canephora]|uniref:CASP-like protein n=2 Tax=Coffea TaxID=13442 RepID=A0A068TQV5_COFCA|nr:CASP-like protein 4D1 [Coffea arabica]XP_027121960.1 CASP-like protein 4D1 [Coffea arabica]CDO98631.1 unnamed protein product [Coffea canephora]
MASKEIVINSVLVLRVITLLALAASVVLLVLNNCKLSDGAKIFFADLHAYWYAVAVAGVGFIYTLIQLPFAVYHVSTEKRWIRNGCLPEFDFYGDKVISFLLASGVGVGFGVTFELKRYFDVVSVVAVALGANAAEVDEERSKASHFLDRENIATGILLVGFVTMAITSILTSIMKSASTKGGGGFFR